MPISEMFTYELVFKCPYCGSFNKVNRYGTSKFDYYGYEQCEICFREIMIRLQSSLFLLESCKKPLAYELLKEINSIVPSVQKTDSAVL